jgi:excisionase family DNA binding protein
LDESQTVRVSVEEAARLLGIEKGSVKKRIHRGKLRSEKDARGTTWVWVDRSETVRDGSQGPSQTDRDELVSEMRERIADLRVQLEAERTASAELRRIVAALTQRIPEIEAPAQQPAPSQASEEAAHEPAGEPPGPAARPGDTAALAAPERESWWRRVFGG